MDNKIIINSDGNKTIIGKEAHDIYFKFHGNFPIPPDQRFYVFNTDLQLLAAQDSIEGATRYMKSDRVLVYQEVA